MESLEGRTNAPARLALIAGVMVSFVFLISGLVLGAATHGKESAVDPDLLLNIGLLALLGTPVARVIVLAGGFIRERKTTFALVAFCILLLLSASVAIGLRGE